ncbi:MAG TPA: hypothetical protein VI385_16395 [Flavisolibacter sp.]
MTAKKKRIEDVVKYLRMKYGADNILINDHWESDETSIGLTDKSKKYLGYISIFNRDQDKYYLGLENPPTNDGLPYSPADSFDNVTLMELESILVTHLQLTKEHQHPRGF